MSLLITRGFGAAQRILTRGFGAAAAAWTATEDRIFRVAAEFRTLFLAPERRVALLDAGVQLYSPEFDDRRYVPPAEWRVFIPASEARTLTAIPNDQE